MQPELVIRHRVLVRAERSYTQSDLAWRRAAERARAWFPADDRPAMPPIGDPGSPLRKLWETRERSIARLMAARAKLDVERERSARRQAQVPARRILLLVDARG